MVSDTRGNLSRAISTLIYLWASSRYFRFRFFAKLAAFFFSLRFFRSTFVIEPVAEVFQSLKRIFLLGAEPKEEQARAAPIARNEGVA